MPYRLGSRSATALALRFTDLFGSRVFQVSRESQTYKPKAKRIVLNWGCSSLPIWHTANTRMINNVNATSIAGNKLLTFRRFTEVSPDLPIPEYTNDKKIARDWATDVVSRAILTGHSGRGITICPAGSDLPEVPLYVKYVKKAKEFRVHVIFGQVVDVQQKKKRESFENANFQVRSHENGWVFCRENIQEPANLREIATQAVESLGLDFGAVDIIWNEKQNKCYVLEVNTAPGLEGTSIDVYAQAFYRKLSNV